MPSPPISWRRGAAAAALALALVGVADGAGPEGGTLLSSVRTATQRELRPQALRKLQAVGRTEWDHLDIQVDNLDTSGLSEDDANYASGLVSSAIQKVCGSDLEVMSLTPEADRVTFSSPKVCSWSPSHWQPTRGTSIMAIILIPETTASIVKLAIQSQQFQNELEDVFAQFTDTKIGSLQVNDIALLPVSPSDDNCNDGAMPSEKPAEKPAPVVQSASVGPSVSQAPEVQDVYQGDDDDNEYRRVEMACSEIGTHPRYGSPRYAPVSEAAGQVVCCFANGTSVRSVGGKCISEGSTRLKTYSEAEQTCMNFGLRLCENTDELDRSCGHGCSLGGTLVWTSEEYESTLADFGHSMKNMAVSGKEMVHDWYDYLKDWRVDMASLLGLLLVFIIIFCIYRSFCVDRRSRELLGGDLSGSDYSMGSGPSCCNWLCMKVKRRPAGYTGDED